MVAKLLIQHWLWCIILSDFLHRNLTNRMFFRPSNPRSLLTTQHRAVCICNRRVLTSRDPRSCGVHYQTRPMCTGWKNGPHTSPCSPGTGELVQLRSKPRFAAITLIHKISEMSPAGVGIQIVAQWHISSSEAGCCRRLTSAPLPDTASV